MPRWESRRIATLEAIALLESLHAKDEETFEKILVDSENLVLLAGVLAHWVLFFVGKTTSLEDFLAKVRPSAYKAFDQLGK